MTCIRKINSGIEVNCSPLPGGVNDRLILLNKEDIVSYTLDPNMPLNVPGYKYVTAVARATGTKGYLFEGINNSIVVRKIAERGTFRIAYRTEIDFVAFDDNGTVEVTLELLNKSNLVAAYESNREFHIIGLTGGLFVQTNSGDTSDADTAGGHRITLIANKEGEYGKRLGIFTGTAPNFVYDYNATKALFEGLLTPAP
jgi:hypothetical protein